MKKEKHIIDFDVDYITDIEIMKPHSPIPFHFRLITVYF